MKHLNHKAVSQYSITEAKNTLPNLVHVAEAGQRVEITRRGKPVAVLLSMDDYDRLTQSQPSFADALHQFCHQAQPEIPATFFDDLRDSSPAREFSF